MRARLTMIEQLELFTGRRCVVLICQSCREHFLYGTSRAKHCSWGCKKAAQRAREAAAQGGADGDSQAAL